MHKTRVDMDQMVYMMPGSEKETKEEPPVASAANTEASEKATALAAPVTPAPRVRRSATSKSDLGSEKDSKTCRRHLNFTPTPVSAKPKRKEGPKGKESHDSVEPEPKRRMRRRVSKAAKAAAGKKCKASTAPDPAAPEPETTEVPPKRFRQKAPPSVPKVETMPTPARRAKAAQASEAVSHALQRTATQELQTPQEKNKESKGKDASHEAKDPDTKVTTPDSNAGKGNEDGDDQDTTKAPKKRREKTPAEKAAHARYMRFSRSLDSSFLS